MTSFADMSTDADPVVAKSIQSDVDEKAAVHDAQSNVAEWE